MRLVLFNWQDRCFADFVVEDEAWERIVARQPSVTLPRKKHAPVTLSWAELRACLEVRDDRHAQAFLTAYDGLREVGTVDLLALLQ
jgi:hypothetical protein